MKPTKNLRIPRQNNENHETRIIQSQNHENLEKVITPRQNQEVHKILIVL